MQSTKRRSDTTVTVSVVQPASVVFHSVSSFTVNVKGARICFGKAGFRPLCRSSALSYPLIFSYASRISRNGSVAIYCSSSMTMTRFVSGMKRSHFTLSVEGSRSFIKFAHAAE